MQPSPFPLATVVYEGLAAEQHLYELDPALTFELFRDVAGYALSQRMGVTGNDPQSAGGSMLYFKLHRRMRDRLAPARWEVERKWNYETTVHPKKLLKIAVAPGDEFTGSPDRTPSTTERGPLTEEVVAWNQYRLWPVDEVRPLDAVPTYLLVHYLRFGDGVAQLLTELSLPTRMAARCVVEWKERILLPIVGMDLDPIARIRDDEPDGGEEAYTAQVERRVV